MRDILLAKLTKRSVDVRFLDLSVKPEKIGGGFAPELIDQTGFKPGGLIAKVAR